MTIVNITNQDSDPRINETGELVYSELSDKLFIKTTRNGVKQIGITDEQDPVFTAWLAGPPNISTFINDVPYLSTVAVDGVTITGDGTIANPLVAVIPVITSAALTKTDDTNVTLTLGGSPNTSLLAATSLTLGWTGTLADSRIASATTWNAKFTLPSLTLGSVLFSNGTTIVEDNANFFWDDTNNRLGIGTTTPTEKLEVNGNALIKTAYLGTISAFGDNYATFSHVSRNGTGDYSVLSDNAGITYINAKSTQSIRFRINNIDKAILDSIGNFGIGTTTPGYVLDVIGTFHTTGQNTLDNLAGTGTRMVVADSVGLLSTQTIPTVGTWGGLNYPTWSSGTPFVKMTAAGTFALDTNTYLTGITSLDVTTALGFTPENVANKSITTTLGTSDTLYPTQNAVKTYVDTATAGLSIDLLQIQVFS